MGSFVSFAIIGGMSVIVVLMWRLYAAVSTQHSIETSLTSASETLEQEKLTATELAQSQSEVIDSLTQEKQALQTQLEQQAAAIAQLKSDHQALQEKYSGLERNLLDHIAKAKTLADTLQTHKLDNARLQRQAELLVKSQTQREQEQQTLLTQHQEISDQHQKYQRVVQAAKEKISTLEREKNQLERDLQQALYQVVALEQEQKPIADFIEIADRDVHNHQTSEPSLPSF